MSLDKPKSVSHQYLKMASRKVKTKLDGIEEN